MAQEIIYYDGDAIINFNCNGNGGGGGLGKDIVLTSSNNSVLIGPTYLADRIVYNLKIADIDTCDCDPRNIVDDQRFVLISGEHKFTRKEF